MSSVSDTSVQGTDPAAAIDDGFARRRKYWLLFLGSGFLLLGLLIGWIAVQLLQGTLYVGPYEFHGLPIQSPRPMNRIALTDQNGELFDLRQLEGQVVAIYFGYTYCPDVCPATLSDLQQARAMIGEDGDQVSVVMISIDPLRDTPEKLGEYLAFFDESFIGLTGTEEELLTAATPLGIFYEKHEGTADSGYLVDHTASVLVLDKDGYLRVSFPYGTPAADIAADLRYLVYD